MIAVILRCDQSGIASRPVGGEKFGSNEIIFPGFAYKAEVTVTEQKHCTLCLPEAKRAMCELYVNGNSAGKQAWGPYCWELTLEAGKNELAFDITTTSYEAFADPAHIERMRAKNYINMYVEKCLEFEKLFPEESPLQKALLRFSD